MTDARSAESLSSQRGRLSTAHAVAQSLAIGPIASAGLVAYLIAGAAGANTPLVVAVVSVGSLALAWTVSLYGRRYAGAGTVYEYIARAHGSAGGVFAAGIYFLPFLVTFAFPVVTSLLIQGFCVEHLGFDPGWWIGGGVSIVVAFVLGLRDIRLSTRTALALTGVSAIPMLLLAAAIIAQGGHGGNTLAVFDPGTPSGGNLFAAILFAAVLFVGFEGAASLGEEMADPHRDIPRAMLFSVGISGLFFTVMTYAATIGFGPSQTAAKWGSNPFAFAALGDEYVGRPLTAVISLAIIVDSFAVQVAFVNIAARGYFVLARDGLLPRSLATVSRRGTPAGGLALISFAGMMMLGVAELFGNHFDALELTVVVLTVTSMSAYLVLAVGALRFIGRGPQAALRVVAVVVAAGVPVLGIWGSVHPWPSGVRRTGLFVALGVFFVAVVWFATLRKYRSEQLSVAGSRALVSVARTT